MHFDHDVEANFEPVNWKAVGWFLAFISAGGFALGLVTGIR